MTGTSHSGIRGQERSYLPPPRFRQVQKGMGSYLERWFTRAEVGAGAPDGVRMLGDRLVTPAKMRPGQPVIPSGGVVRGHQDQSPNFRDRHGQQISGPPFLPSSPVTEWRITAR